MITHIYFARIVMEADTTFGIGSGNAGILSDREVVRDANGFPMIPGTSLAGVLRHVASEGNQLSLSELDDIFGYQKAVEGSGSRLRVSNGYMMINKGTVSEGIEDLRNEALYQVYKNLPLRDHVRINDKGTAEDKEKFDEELVFKGTRFVFELEFQGYKKDEIAWNQLLNMLYISTFRLGAGTRKGYGKFNVLDIQARIYRLTEGDMPAWLAKSSSMNKIPEGLKKHNAETVTDALTHYILEIRPDNFFVFGSGIPDDEADMTPKYEPVITWINGSPVLDEPLLLIPATSVKGALSHRTAYHYNRRTKFFAKVIGSNSYPELDKEIPRAALEAKIQEIVDHDMIDRTSSLGIKQLMEAVDSLNLDELSQDIFDKHYHREEPTVPEGVGELNPAVRQLFGYAKKDETAGTRGRVILNDIYLPKPAEVILNHVSLDRFTGGARAGALFTEKVSPGKDLSLIFDIYVDTNNLDPDAIVAFEDALDDLCKGLLPLGGGSTRGHGRFTGTYKKEASA